MAHGNVSVRVRVGFGAVPGEMMFVAVVLLVGMRVGVRERFVMVQVPMVLGEMQGDTRRDQDRGEPEERIGNFTEQRKRRRSTDEGRGCKIGTRSRRAEEAKGDDEQGEAHPVSQKADCRCGQHGIHRRPRRAERGRRTEIDRARRQPLDSCYLDRIASRNLAR